MRGFALIAGIVIGVVCIVIGMIATKDVEKNPFAVVPVLFGYGGGFAVIIAVISLYFLY